MRFVRSTRRDDAAHMARLFALAEAVRLNHEAMARDLDRLDVVAASMAADIASIRAAENRATVAWESRYG